MNSMINTCAPSFSSDTGIRKGIQKVYHFPRNYN